MAVKLSKLYGNLEASDGGVCTTLHHMMCETVLLFCNATIFEQSALLHTRYLV